MNKAPKILALEDDAIHQEILEMNLAQLGYHLIDILATPKRLFELLKSVNPDVILMDIDLGGDNNGIEITHQINEEYDIPVIFLTAQQDDSVFNKAKATKPFGYLIKPYKKEDLKRCVELTLLHESQQEKTQKSKPFIKHLFLRSKDELVKVQTDEITHISAYDKYCNIHTKTNKIMVRERLKNIVQLLPEDNFVQIHRSYVVNLDEIQSFSNDMKNVYIGNFEMSIGRSFKKNLYLRINTVG